MSSTTYLITGASRGLGLEFARQLLASDATAQVIAAARNPATATELQHLIKEYPARLHSVMIDVSDAKSVADARVEVEKLAPQGLDILINNAGVLTAGWKTATKSTAAELQTDLNTNLFGVINSTSTFLPLLRAGRRKTIWTVSSLVGSIGGPISETGNAATYAVSKAAVNMYLRKLAKELDPEGFTIIAFHPGYVTTDMNGGTAGPAAIHKEESVAKSLEILQSKTSSQSGTFWSYTGDALPW